MPTINGMVEMEKILVIDDNKLNRLLFGDILRYHGYEVFEAGDGAEGIKMAREHKPGLILMDMQMPVMDGFAAIKILKEDPETKAIKVVAITGFAMKEDKVKIMGAGFDSYVTKPIETKMLPDLVKKLLTQDAS